MIPERLQNSWARFWMRYAGLGISGRLATRLASWGAPPYYGRIPLARNSPQGYISPRAIIYHSQLQLGANIFIDDGVLIYQDRQGGAVELAEGVHLNRETIIQTGQGGYVKIGDKTHIQPRCQFSAYKAPIQIGCRVEIAPYCAFYPYDHGMSPGNSIREQPLRSRGGIRIGDEAWLGVGVIVLDGARIGEGAVVGAGAVVTNEIPAGSIAVGVPARVVKHRSELAHLKD